MLGIKVDDIMTEHIVKLPEDAKIMQAAHILLRFRINGVPVVKKDDESRLVGVITTTDLLRMMDEVFSSSVDIRENFNKMAMLEVWEVASKSVVSIDKSASIKEAVDMMHRLQIHTIPVRDGDEIVGVIGRHDIINIVFLPE